jgi:hypothetical protein
MDAARTNGGTNIAEVFINAVANIAEEFNAPLPMSRRSSLCHTWQYRGTFIAPLPTEKSYIALRYQLQLPNLFIAPFPTSVCSKLKAADRSVWIVYTLFSNSPQPHEMAL